MLPDYTPEEMLYDIDHCTGPCGQLCMSCPEAFALRDIRKIIADLLEENKKYKAIFKRIADENFKAEMSRTYGISF